jgi:hypothetical protein
MAINDQRSPQEEIQNITIGSNTMRKEYGFFILNIM